MRVHALHVLLFAILLVAGDVPLAQDASGQALETVECSTCMGVGSHLQACLWCSGSGDWPCGTCQPRAHLPRNVRAEPTGLSKEEEELIALLRELDEPLALGLGRSKAGHLRCPSPGCADGRVLGAAGDCTYCKGELFPCKSCRKKSVLDCSACHGKGKSKRTCEDCVGRGRIPNPHRLPLEGLERCSWCNGTERTACRSCIEGKVELACRACLGKKLETCRECVGSKKMPCRSCRATGKVGGPGSTSRCNKCRGKGAVACTHCTKGKVSCTLCSGRGALELACAACDGDLAQPCFGCFAGGWRSWDLNAQLTERDAAPRAARFLEIASTRCAAHYDARSKEPDLTEEQVRAINKEKRRALGAIEKRLQSARRRSDAPDPEDG